MLDHLIHMGGYALYVWPAYFITLTVFAMNVAISYRERKKVTKMILQYLAKQTS